MHVTKVISSTLVLGSVLLGGLAPAEAAKLIRTWDVEAAIGRGANHVVWMPPLPGVGSDFIADGDITFNEFDDGTANLFGSVVAEDDANKKWNFNVWLEGYSSTPGDGGAKTQLNPSAYVENGGTVDPTTWNYYEFHSTKDSVFTGVAGSDYDGKTLYIEDSTNGRFIVQVGEGANGKNTNMGLSTWFKFSGDYTGDKADFNVDLVEVPEPVTVSLIGIAVLGLGASQLKRKN